VRKHELEAALHREATRGLVIRPRSRIPERVQRLLERLLIWVGRRLT
jgi:hypothetical protein